MRQYLELLECVLNNGVKREDRTGTGTKSIFGYQIRFNLLDGFPLVTTKRLHIKSIIYELLWFLEGGTNIKYLNDKGVSIWDEWADDDGELGPTYGNQWRSWTSTDGEKHDQISNVITSIKHNPYSRRHIVSAWNVGDLDKMNLPPCHILFQFYVSEGKLSCQLYQRSADIFLGIPFNIASYSLLTMMVADQVGLKYGDFIHTLGDAHLYDNHIKQAEVQVQRSPKNLPEMSINKSVPSIFDYKYDDFVLNNYDAHEHIKADVAV